MKLPRINNKLGAITLLTLLTACSNDSTGDLELSSDANKQGIPLPAGLQVKSLPENGVLSAYITCSTVGERKPVDEIDLTTGFIKASCDGLTPGEHTFRIEFEFESNEYGTITLANADKTLNIVNGANNLGFLDDDYQYDDNDSDEISNIWELTNGLNPQDSGDAVADGDEDSLDNLAEFKAGTDPKNSDTDSDGLNDGAETTAGRNPLINEPAVMSIVQLLLDD